MKIMSKHNLQACIELAEGIPQDAGNFRVIRELLIELRTLAKDAEVTK